MSVESARAQKTILLFIYVFVNTLFVWKYGSPYFSNQIIAPVLYVIASAIILWVILSPGINIVLSPAGYRILYITFTFVATILLVILMFQYDPGKIGVGRYPAMYDWITKLFNGEFPYDSATRPSGLPFLFVMAIPFYLLGDVGLFQIFSFLVFAGILYYNFRGSYKTSLRLLILLLISPIFIFEVVVRSELFSNMVMVLLYLTICEKYLSKDKLYLQIILGLLGGLLLSTRSIVLVILFFYFIWKFRNSNINPFITVLSLLFGFIITLIPFVIWNYDYFINHGPMAVQALYAPQWFIVLSIILSFIWAIRIKRLHQIYFASAGILFLIVLGATILYIVRFGLTESILYDKFDISYYCFPLPFVLMSLGAATERSNTSKPLP